jgi:hypothetical protein
VRTPCDFCAAPTAAAAGKSDPFVELFTTKDDMRTTRVINNNLAPEWNEVRMPKSLWHIAAHNQQTCLQLEPAVPALQLLLPNPSLASTRAYPVVFDRR